jgi:RNA polymerase sigma factor (sigma-70 family)
MSDQEIIELLKNGKQDKPFRALYKHFPSMKKLILSKGGKLEDAEDIYQEALIILFGKVNEADFKLTSQLHTYLYSICRILWKDELKKRNQLQFADVETKLNKAEEDNLEELLENENKAKLAEKVIMELGEKCKELLLLFYAQALSMKKIATKMGYNSENTVKNQKYKCLEAAKKKLKKLKEEK